MTQRNSIFNNNLLNRVMLNRCRAKKSVNTSNLIQPKYRRKIKNMALVSMISKKK